MNSNTRFYVKFNPQLSNNFVGNIGVTQGENLSSLLFAFKVDDIKSKIT